jgi:flagellar basal body-associated protein FliL
MSRYSKNENGAALIVELVVLAVVLVAAGLAGYRYVSQKNTASQATKPKPHVVAITSPSPSSTPALTPRPQPSNIDAIVAVERAHIENGGERLVSGPRSS